MVVKQLRKERIVSINVEEIKQLIGAKENEKVSLLDNPQTVWDIDRSTDRRYYKLGIGDLVFIIHEFIDEEKLIED